MVLQVNDEPKKEKVEKKNSSGSVLKKPVAPPKDIVLTIPGKFAKQFYEKRQVYFLFDLFKEEYEKK